MYYETIYIVNPDISKEHTEELTDKLVERVEKAAGRIVKREYWGSRALAYPINKRRRGHYILLVTDGEPQALATLEQGIRLDERIMRFMSTSINEISDEPSPLIRRRAAPKVDNDADVKDAKPEAQTADAEVKEAVAETAAAPEATAEA